MQECTDRSGDGRDPGIRPLRPFLALAPIATLAHPGAGDGGVTLAELASARGIPKDAARRLVKAGKVSAHQIVGDHGPE